MVRGRNRRAARLRLDAGFLGEVFPKRVEQRSGAGRIGEQGEAAEVVAQFGDAIGRNFVRGDDFDEHELRGDDRAIPIVRRDSLGRIDDQGSDRGRQGEKAMGFRPRNERAEAAGEVGPELQEVGQGGLGGRLFGPAGDVEAQGLHLGPIEQIRGGRGSKQFLGVRDGVAPVVLSDAGRVEPAEGFDRRGDAGRAEVGKPTAASLPIAKRGRERSPDRQKSQNSGDHHETAGRAATQGLRARRIVEAEKAGRRRRIRVLILFFVHISSTSTCSTTNSSMTIVSVKAGCAMREPVRPESLRISARRSDRPVGAAR